MARPLLRPDLTLPADAPRLPLSDAGAGGELIVARVRLALAASLLLLPLRGIVGGGPMGAEDVVGLVAIVVANLAALGVLRLARAGGHRWLGLATSVLDVSLVGATLAAFVVMGEPLTAANSRVVFECYFVAIAATCLRYDWRVCVAAGALAIAQFGGISLWVASEPRLASYPVGTYGAFDWASQSSRLIVLAVATALAATIVRRGQALRQLAVVDRLTGLWNRGYFDERVEEELARARRAGSTLAVALLDVDRFKLYNDNYGHAAGDAALQALACQLRRVVRPADVVARYGGEEFVVLFPSTDADEAEERLETLRRAVSRLAVPTPDDHATVRMTVSAGLATWPGDGEAVDELLHAADLRLLDAKRSGRDRTVRGARPQLTLRTTPFPGGAA